MYIEGFVNSSHDKPSLCASEQSVSIANVNLTITSKDEIIGWRICVTDFTMGRMFYDVAVQISCVKIDISGVKLEDGNVFGGIYEIGIRQVEIVMPEGISVKSTTEVRAVRVEGDERNVYVCSWALE
jgi:hypothetical protein